LRAVSGAEEKVSLSRKRSQLAVEPFPSTLEVQGHEKRCLISKSFEFVLWARH
jgi:hypothetical protein